MKDVREVQAVVDGLMYGACDRLEDYHSKRDGENAIKWFREALSAANLEIGPGWNTDMEAGKKYVNDAGKPVLGYWPDCHSDDQFKISVPCDDPFIQWTDVADTIDPDFDGQPTAWKPILPPEGGE